MTRKILVLVLLSSSGTRSFLSLCLGGVTKKMKTVILVRSSEIATWRYFGGEFWWTLQGGVEVYVALVNELLRNWASVDVVIFLAPTDQLRSFLPNKHTQMFEVSEYPQLLSLAQVVAKETEVQIGKMNTTTSETLPDPVSRMPGAQTGFPAPALSPEEAGLCSVISKAGPCQARMVQGLLLSCHGRWLFRRHARSCQPSSNFIHWALCLELKQIPS